MSVARPSTQLPGGEARRRLAPLPPAPDRPATRRCREPRRWAATPGNAVWLTGLLLFVSGTVANFVSFSFAAQSLLAALGAVQFVSNVAFARLVNGEHCSWRVLAATALIVAGCVLLVAFGSHASPTLDAADMLHLYEATPYIVFLSLLLSTAAACYVAYRYGKRRLAEAKQGPGRWAASRGTGRGAGRGALG